MTDLYQLDQLIPLPSPRAQQLAAAIAALREAQEMVTTDATPAQIYGRIDSAIQERQRALYDEYQAQCRALDPEAVLAEVHLRG